jgi:C-terminal processing protease CtpA/Prc
VLKNQRRATIVGTRTAGAGHMVAFAPAGYGFTLGFSS